MYIQVIAQNYPQHNNFCVIIATHFIRLKNESLEQSGESREYIFMKYIVWNRQKVAKIQVANYSLDS